MQIMVNPIRFDARTWFPGIRKRQQDVWWAGIVQLHPESRGWVELKSADPREIAAVTLNILDTENDRRQLRDAIRLTRKIYRTEPMGELVGEEKTPGEQVQSDAELDAYMRDWCYVGQHPTSTCAMGMGDRSVVDSELRVIGVEGLRVADASVMPTVPGGNTMIPAIMVGEKAADLIRGQSLPAAELAA
jgi:choline dehydrogenase